MLKRAWRAFLFGFALVAIALGIPYLVPLYDQICAQEDKATHKYCDVFNALASGIFAWLDAHGIGITALATVAIAIFTTTLWRATTATLSHSRQVERAYVSIGVEIEWENVDTYTVTGTTTIPPYRFARFLRLVLSNNGKTAAHVGEIATVICDRAAIPEIPDYSNSNRLANISLSPETTNFPTQFSFEFREIAGKVIYGRVYYTDIYKESHSSGFIRHILSSATSAIEAPHEFTDWD